MDVDARMVAERLAKRVAQLEMEIAVLQSALAQYEEQEQGQEPEE